MWQQMTNNSELVEAAKVFKSFEDQYYKFIDIIRAHPIYSKWHEIIPGRNHNGSLYFNEFNYDIVYDNYIVISGTVSCCGGDVDWPARNVPINIFLNPTKENLDKLLAEFNKDDEAAKQREIVEEQKRKELEQAEFKKRNLNTMNEWIKQYGLEVGPVGPGTATDRFNKLMDALKTKLDIKVTRTFVEKHEAYFLKLIDDLIEKAAKYDANQNAQVEKS